MDNYQLVVGNEDCPLKTILKIVLNSAIIRNDWLKFAKHLDVSNEQIESFRRDLLLKTITSAEIIYKVILIWKARNGSKATLATLLQVVEGHCGANDVGELLRLEYKLPCKRKRSDTDDSIGWEDLSPAFKKRVTEAFQLFFPNLKPAEVLPKLSGSVLVCLMRGTKPHVLSYQEEMPCKRKRSDRDNNDYINAWEALSPEFRKQMTETFQPMTPHLFNSGSKLSELNTWILNMRKE